MNESLRGIEIHNQLSTDCAKHSETVWSSASRMVENHFRFIFGFSLGDAQRRTYSSGKICPFNSIRLEDAEGEQLTRNYIVVGSC
jgi:hypothetical protein